MQLHQSLYPGFGKTADARYLYFNLGVQNVGDSASISGRSFWTKVCEFFRYAIRHLDESRTKDLKPVSMSRQVYCIRYLIYLTLSSFN